MRAFIHSLLVSQKGATAVEYGLILSLIVLALVTGVSHLGSATTRTWNEVSNEVTSH
ncbi:MULTISPECIES: Flp family type IVb pilin [Sphingobium]|uniref:Flp family type IVb pilin n=1 Tax=Sphingobium TaxID=165695 RepID=UPI00185DC2EF|nr:MULTISPECIES: Flp family type IVb pilin [Sphingobium]MCW2361744.1 pilus assembly protein Flp/PilA [Sphingobium sp. B10D3B]MCW2401577.1 pilus assembly protein Flp/PilA [Sphingobium sp. B10D7B]MCW2408557.1 pilus assembly protein Flp/PilA [Sphingobium xanthum]